MKKAACQGDLMMANNPEATVGQPSSHAVWPCDTHESGHNTDCVDDAQSQITPADPNESVNHAGGETANTEMSLHPMQVLHEAELFLRLLGKDPAKTWFRTLKPIPDKGSLSNVRRRGADLHGFDAAALEADNRAGSSIYFITGDADKATGKNKKTGKATGAVEDTNIHTCRAVFVEWDDKPIEWQVSAWRELGLPEPTAMITTGGKSVHCYWHLSEPMQPDAWKVLQLRLINYAGGDTDCKNPSRLMRLPGFAYVNKKTGEVTSNRAELIQQADLSYTAEEIEACLPAASIPEVVKPTPKPGLIKHRQGVDYAPRSIEEIEAAAAFIPERVVGGSTYETSRNALCGCAAALTAIGEPEDRVLDLLADKWPDRSTAAQVLDSTTTRDPASFWAIAAENGYQLKRNPSREHNHDPSPAEVRQRTYKELLTAMLAAITANDDDTLMELRAEMIARFRRNDAQVEAALFKLHTDKLTQGEAITPPASLDLSRISGMDWLIEGFVPDNDLTLLWGNAGAGKTTAALAAALAVIRGTGLLDHTQPSPRRNVLFIASDSGAPPLYAAMQDMGMADLPEVKDGPDKRFHVWASDPNQGMTSWAADLRGCIRLLHFVRSNQIGLVLIDSCKAVCSGAGLDYTNNQLVTSLLTYFKEVICPHTAVVWLNHDGVVKGAPAGAKAFKEIPSMVHSIIREEQKDGTIVDSRRQWRVMKSRMGGTRDFIYELNLGVLQLCQFQEKVGNCLDRVVDVLKGAWQLQSEASLSKSDLAERICRTLGPSRKTLDNTLASATRAKHPVITRAGRGRYALAPRVKDTLLKGCISKREVLAENDCYDWDFISSRQLPDDENREVQLDTKTTVAPPAEVPEFPTGKSVGKSPEGSHSNGSGQILPDLHAPLLGIEASLRCDAPAPAVGSGADAFEDDDDPAWGPRVDLEPGLPRLTPEEAERQCNEAFAHWHSPGELEPGVARLTPEDAERLFKEASKFS